MDGLINKAFAPAVSVGTRFEDSDRTAEAEILEQRLEKHRSIAQRFAERATSIKAPFSILLWGSTAYGYNRGKEHSMITDIDMGLLVPQSVTFDSFLKDTAYVFGSGLASQTPYLKGFFNGDWDMCRMYGEYEGVRLEFFVMRTEAIRYLATDAGSQEPIQDVANPSYKVLVETNWSIKHWRPILMRFGHEEITGPDGSKRLIMKNYFFAKNDQELSSFGARLLQAISLYDPSETSELDKRVQLSLWFLFVDACLKEHPDLTNDDIVNALVRSERFSPEFRARLVEIVEEVRFALSA